jgi:hypothetical protein
MILCSFLIGSSWTVFALSVMMIAMLDPYIYVPTPNSYSFWPALIIGVINATTVFVWLKILHRDPQEPHRYVVAATAATIAIVSYFVLTGIRRFKSDKMLGIYILSDIVTFGIVFYGVYLLESWLCAAYNPMNPNYKPIDAIPNWSGKHPIEKPSKTNRRMMGLEN